VAASACFGDPRTTTRKEPRLLRYPFHAHRGMLDAKRAGEVFRAFGKRSPLELVKARAMHTAYGVRRRERP
jgi:hypothetical protein